MYDIVTEVQNKWYEVLTLIYGFQGRKCFIFGIKVQNGYRYIYLSDLC